ncbi:MAG: class I mannose-6-phosphate isomerase [Peptoniphilaceae bacterium]|nr:class I mannose-6-phosphate isomerase [Peptoniphilaceae bacterium]MDY6018714.1 type I phosphomannose isomerase catalytic subunit [Anaerococcus sp.]
MEKVLFLKGKFVEKIWGGDRLKNFGYDLPSNKVGEYWAISGMDDLESEIINGSFKGQNLKDIYKDHKELFGKEDKASFPLLIKLIDANDDLSIQVHPDDRLAQKYENSLGKTECWYMLNDEPSSIIYGLKVNDKNEAIKLIDEKRWDDLLREVNSQKDDFFYVPAGTVHAIKKGSLVLEIQQASDITYRLYDYDRKDDQGNLRDLHLEESKRSIKTELVENKPEKKEYETYIRTDLLSNQYFEVRKFEIKDKTSFKREKPYLLEAVTEGKGELILGEERYPIKKGDFFILTNLVDNFEIEGKVSLVESNSK